MGSELDVFVGSWRTTGLLWADPDQEPVEFQARDRYGWFPGGHFLLHHVEANMAGAEVRALEIGRHDPAGGWVFESYDNSGGHVVFRARLSGDDWRIESDTERFAGTFTDGGQRISGRWERRVNAEDWEHWMDVTLEKEI